MVNKPDDEKVRELYSDVQVLLDILTASGSREVPPNEVCGFCSNKGVKCTSRCDPKEEIYPDFHLVEKPPSYISETLEELLTAEKHELSKK